MQASVCAQCSCATDTQTVICPDQINLNTYRLITQKCISKKWTSVTKQSIYQTFSLGDYMNSKLCVLNFTKIRDSHQRNRGLKVLATGSGGAFVKNEK